MSMSLKDMLSFLKRLNMTVINICYWYKIKIQFENKLIIDTRIKFCIYTRRAFRLHKTHQWRSIPNKLNRGKIQIEEHWGPKFIKVLPNTAKVIYFLGRKKTLSISKIQNVCKQLNYKYDHINKCWLLSWWYPRNKNSTSSGIDQELLFTLKLWYTRYS